MLASTGGYNGANKVSLLSRVTQEEVTLADEVGQEKDQDYLEPQRSSGVNGAADPL